MINLDRACTGSFLLAERLEHGNLTIDELSRLAGRGKTAIYADIRCGRLKVEKFGRSTRVRGPVAKAYIAGEVVVA